MQACHTNYQQLLERL